MSAQSQIARFLDQHPGFPYWLVGPDAVLVQGETVQADGQVCVDHMLLTTFGQARAWMGY